MGVEQKSRLIVADTGPLLRLEEMSAWRLLEPFAPVTIPLMVAEECRRLGVPLVAPGLALSTSNPPDFELERILPAVLAELINPAEGEAIAWCLSETSSMLLTDDAAARTLAESMNVEVHGSIGLLLFNRSTRQISHEDAVTLLASLAASSLWVSRKVFIAAESILEELKEEV